MTNQNPFVNPYSKPKRVTEWNTYGEIKITGENPKKDIKKIKDHRGRSILNIDSEYQKSINYEKLKKTKT